MYAHCCHIQNCTTHAQQAHTCTHMYTHVHTCTHMYTHCCQLIRNRYSPCLQLLACLVYKLSSHSQYKLPTVAYSCLVYKLLSHSQYKPDWLYHAHKYRMLIVLLLTKMLHHHARAAYSLAMTCGGVTCLLSVTLMAKRVWCTHRTGRFGQFYPYAFYKQVWTIYWGTKAGMGNFSCTLS